MFPHHGRFSSFERLRDCNSNNNNNIIIIIIIIIITAIGFSPGGSGYFIHKYKM